ncbi:MAG: SUMF1/EgtB/PvdO family nonheme iron enzyme [Alcanivorax sp.]|uniref:formylglycine-generating enzyme family protein n=1 Tax=Alcanivorax sp. TaxID=1872427 RepID=UPI002630C7ED|nr:SUMF1/EgtB/PvdO family nonheme iron enzyme [Alcanivorax sp.]MDF1723118.1 SUMF1/EgtB/PvdO family nonheme iron enzyme [Alcanivorax sp.]
MKRRLLLINSLTSLSLSLLAGCGNSADISEAEQKVIDHTMESLVFVEGGTFTMGHPQVTKTVEVTLDSYSIQAYEVSYWEFDTFAEATGARKPSQRSFGKPSRQPENPAWGLTWYDAQNYCHWLGELTGLPFELPTEAQWEYAATSRGTSRAFYATDDGTQDYGRNYPGSKAPWHPEPSGTYPPNPLGMYDMTGNVAEWVQDWYDKNYYEKSPGVNPKGPDSGTKKLLRGGSVGGTQRYNVLFRRARATEPDDKQGGVRCVVNQPNVIAVSSAQKEKENSN